MAADSGQYTPETIARRIAMAEALLAPRKRPITHWAEGLDELAKGALGGYQLNKAEEMERRGRSGAYERIARLLNGEPSPIASSTGTDAIRGAMPALRSEATPGPGGNLGAEDMARMARMVNAEAGNQDMTGKQAVANVILNRSQQSGMPIGGVINAPGEFEPAMTAGGRSKMAALDPNSRAYQEAEMAALNALEKDPTGGATHFYAPKTQADLGRATPGWDNGTGVDIGDHRFFKLGYNGAGGQGGGIPAIAQALQPTAQDGPQPPQSPAGTTGAPGGVPIAPPMVQPTGGVPGPVAGPTGAGGTGGPGGTGGNSMAAIAAMLTDPWVDPKTASAVLGMTTPNLQPHTDADGNVYTFNAKTGEFKLVRQAPVKPIKIGENDRLVHPLTGQPVGPSGIPNEITLPNGEKVRVPEGQDPKKFREHITTATADALAGKLTEVQQKANQFATRMELAEKNVSGLEDQALGMSGAAQQIGGSVPVIGSALQSADYQKYAQSKSQFITALLRQESGAAINKSEFERYEKELYPQSGDAPGVIAQKRESRRAAIEAMRKGAGPGSKPAAEIPAASTAVKAAKPAPAVGAVQDGYRFKGGDPAKRENWEREAGA